MLIKFKNRLLSKLAYAERFEGDAERRTAAYSNVREDSSTASTYKSPAEVEFRKKSNELISKIILNVQRYMQ
ncbi:palindromic element RPE1 domain-containing protein [Candidatus Tisiphia endosymbiont of Melanophora roralis]|uniref:palindromic element RPE1 domain-containing protein n=1 Tax=Candidatus Tisiphia endosymbiont of Melanophora roralis TaxID=3066261 RepID=UPI00312C9EEE